MQPFQQRVVDEKKDLDDKLGKLIGFFATEMFSVLPVDEQERMKEQSEHMRSYSTVLGERIEAFT